MGKKKIISMVCVAAAMMFLFACGKSHRVITVQSFDGDVTYARNGSTENVFADMNLNSGDEIKVGSDSALELLADSDKHIFAEADTSFKIADASGTEESGRIRIYMEYGTVKYAVDNKLSDKSSFEVETSNATMSIRGTEFIVSVGDNETFVKVLEGTVNIKSDNGDMDVEAGISVNVDKDGDIKELETFDELINGVQPTIFGIEGLGMATTSDIVEFGSYNGEPIRWYVLEKSDGEAMLFSVSNVAYRTLHHEDPEVLTWEDCDLRKWLNEDFYNEAFTDEEKSRMVLTTVPGDVNPIFGTSNGNDTQDMVWLLSVTEAETYFHIDREQYEIYRSERTADNMDEKLAVYSAYCYGQDSRIKAVGTNEYEHYWLRSTGKLMESDDDLVQYDPYICYVGVGTNGALLYPGYNPSRYVESSDSSPGVRPVIVVRY